MRSHAAIMGLWMLFGVQLIPGYWQVSGDYVVPNANYMPVKTGLETKTGASAFQNKTGKTGAEIKADASNPSTGAGSAASTAAGGAGAGTSGGSPVFGGGTGSTGGIGLTAMCGPLQASTDVRGIAGATWETNLNDWLPYDWAKKFWLCGCPPISMEGSGLYWQSRPIIMCMF